LIFAALTRLVMKKYWKRFATILKVLCVILLLYTIIGGFLMPVPAKDILNESIRNLYFHVPMWFSMMSVLTFSCVTSILYLNDPVLKWDIMASQSAHVGLLFAVIGFVTGAIWANYTWGAPWSNDIKQLCTVIALLVYFAYFVLRNAFNDIDRRAKVSAVYNIFAYALLIPLLFIIPRLSDSLHPGGSGNPAFSQYDLDDRMRMVFYPCSIGWILLAAWITELNIRIKRIELKSLLP
jgi:heme exporter protein C